MKRVIYSVCLFSFLLLNCSSDNNGGVEPDFDDDTPSNPSSVDFKILSLGDSYTIGQGVCASCHFPAQLVDSLKERNDGKTFQLDIIAQTGWTTTNLQDAVTSRNPDNDYDFVTLLIGVNNQYQSRPFSVYENEFPLLLEQAISFAGGNKNRVVVVSIPDYAYTPFGQSTTNPEGISSDIDDYNSFALTIANQMNVSFINITDITRQGLDSPSLVSSDGLHPSTEAYQQFVARILPEATQVIE